MKSQVLVRLLILVGIVTIGYHQEAFSQTVSANSATDSAVFDRV